MPAFTQAQLAAAEGKFFRVGTTRHCRLVSISPLTKKDGSLVYAGKVQMFKFDLEDVVTGEKGEEVSTALLAEITRLNDDIDVGKTILTISCEESSNQKYPGFRANIADPAQIEQDKKAIAEFNSREIPTEEIPM